MAVLITRETKVICQGFTGAQGTFEGLLDHHRDLRFIRGMISADDRHRWVRIGSPRQPHRPLHYCRLCGRERRGDSRSVRPLRR